MKKFFDPEIKLNMLQVEDVITTSGDEIVTPPEDNETGRD